MDEVAIEDKRKDREVAQPSGFVSFLKELPLLVLTAVVIAYIIKAFVVQPFYIPSGSMEPTLYPGDRVLVTKFMYWFTEPKEGDIIVFVSPTDSRDLIKRVVATEGQTLEVRMGKVLIDGQPLKQDYKTNTGDYSNFGPVKVPKDKLFVMGDNRPNSADSRVFGLLAEKNVLGKAFVIYWPIDRAGLTR